MAHLLALVSNEKVERNSIYTLYVNKLVELVMVEIFIHDHNFTISCGNSMIIL